MKYSPIACVLFSLFLATTSMSMDDNNILDKQDEQKQCGICIENLSNEFHTLSCNHSYCRSCLKQMFAYKIKTRDTSLSCPNCRHPITLSKINSMKMANVSKKIRNLLKKPINNREHNLPDDDENQRLSLNWITRNTRPCPSCGIPQIKVDGCCSVSCSWCDTGFDWNTREIHPGIQTLNRLSKGAAAIFLIAPCLIPWLLNTNFLLEHYPPC